MKDLAKAITGTVCLLNFLLLLFILKILVGFGLGLFALFIQMTRAIPSSGLI